MRRMEKSVDEIRIDAGLDGECNRKNDQQCYCVNDSFKNDSSNKLFGGNFFIPCEQCTFQYFAQAWNSEICQITNHHGEKSIVSAGIIVKRVDKQFPSQCPYEMAKKQNGEN